MLYSTVRSRNSVNAVTGVDWSGVTLKVVCEILSRVNGVAGVDWSGVT